MTTDSEGWKNIQLLLQKLRRNDISITGRDGELHYQAAIGSFTPDLRDAVSEAKSALLDEVSEAPYGTTLQIHDKFRLPMYQWKMWHELIDNGDLTEFYSNRTNFVFKLCGSFSLERFQESLDHITHLYPIIGYRIDRIEGAPSFRVSELQPIVEYSDKSSDIDSESLETLVKEMVWRPLSVNSGPLMRCGIIKTGPHEYVVAMVVHHCIADGQSLSLLISGFVQQLLIDPQAPTVTQAHAPNYLDYLRMQQRWCAGPQGREARRYWRSQLTSSRKTALPQRTRRHDRCNSYLRSRKFLLDPDLWSTVKRLAALWNVTPFAVTLAAYALAMTRISGSSQITTLVLTSVRNWIGFELSFGPFNNIFPVNIEFHENVQLHKVALKVFEMTVAAQPYINYPFDLMSDDMGVSYNKQFPLFNFMDFPEQSEQKNNPASLSGVISDFPLTVQKTIPIRGRPLESHYIAIHVMPDHAECEFRWSPADHTQRTVSIFIEEFKSALGGY
ncbi:MULTISPECIES: condensation domain-containing protein [unclassified Sphingomonas]|jgi:hypothetical protein|uniref:condensation domain-containing protein n=1 Tax=unclassified Sphingomonas TaxID=196159 RepID=UPI0009E78BAF|nr:MULTISPECIES: condensation domain-containing protein [unclassified Sphingomonas]